MFTQFWDPRLDSEIRTPAFSSLSLSPFLPSLTTSQIPETRASTAQMVVAMAKLERFLDLSENQEITLTEKGETN